MLEGMYLLGGSNLSVIRAVHEAVLTQDRTGSGNRCGSGSGDVGEHR
jgi:hypothetical protein